ncbi:TPA: hypothetical protein SI311_003773, partial [Escherichia coli]|nr:hypothetical protein [Escherichia coli]
IHRLKLNSIYAKEASEGSTILVDVRETISEAYGVLDKWNNLQHELIEELGEPEYFHIKHGLSEELSVASDLVTTLENLIHIDNHFSEERLEKLININKRIKETADTIDSYLRIAIDYLDMVH